MYVYKVTHIPTGRFYLGLSTKDKSTYDPARDLDPYNQFEVNGDNGSRLKMVNVEKRIISLAGDINELATIGAQVAKSNQDNPNFLGLKGQSKSHTHKPTEPAGIKTPSALSGTAPKSNTSA